MTRRRVTQYSRARRDEPPGSDRGGDTERPGDEPLRRVRESAAAAAHDGGLFSTPTTTARGVVVVAVANVNEASIDASSFLGFFHQFVHNYYTVRSFVYIFLSLFLMQRANGTLFYILFTVSSLSLSLHFFFFLSFTLSLSLKVVVVVRSPRVVGGAGLTRVRVRARD
jgi:hypothetical protein